MPSPALLARLRELIESNDRRSHRLAAGLLPLRRALRGGAEVVRDALPGAIATLDDHFGYEEQSGLYRWVPREIPAVAPVLSGLRAQHPGLLAGLCEGLDAHPDVPGRVRAALDRLQTHEAGEWLALQAAEAEAMRRG